MSGRPDPLRCGTGGNVWKCLLFPCLKGPPQSPHLSCFLPSMQCLSSGLQLPLVPPRGGAVPWPRRCTIWVSHNPGPGRTPRQTSTGPPSPSEIWQFSDHNSDAHPQLSVATSCRRSPCLCSVGLVHMRPPPFNQLTPTCIHPVEFDFL